MAEKAQQDERTYQSCLRMYTSQKIFQSPYVMAVYATKGPHTALGTGVVANINGAEYVITNNHVIEGADDIFLQFSHADKQIYTARVIGRDPAADLALLIAPVLSRGIGTVLFGRSPRLGEEVYALGYPHDMRSVTFGFINALETRSWLYFLMQAPINPGNSGGPLFNANHELIGFNTVIIPGATMGFAISIKYARQILSRLTREQLVEHGDVGFDFADTWRMLPPFFAKHSLSFPPAEQGIMVVRIDPASHAAKNGIKIGDLIVALNGAAIMNAEDLDRNVFLHYRPGDEIVLTTKRGAQMFERRIKLMAYASPFAGAQ